MKDPNGVDFEDPSFDAALRAGIKDIRRQKGPCPDTEVLARYLNGHATKEETADLVTHVAACGVCDALLERGRAFHAPLEQEDALVSQTDWNSIDQRLSSRFEALLDARQLRKIQGVSTRSNTFQNLLGVLSPRPIFAYLLAAILLIPAYLGVKGLWQLRPDVAQPARTVHVNAAPGAFESAGIFHLESTRRTSTDMTVLSLGANQRHFIVTFLVPIHPDRSHSVTIVDSQTGKTVEGPKEVRSSDHKGSFYLICNREQFPKGEYLLTLMETEPIAGPSIKREQFYFGVQ